MKGVGVPRASKQTASQVKDMGVLESRSEELGGYIVEFTTFRGDADATPFFRGLPDDRYQSARWRYVLQGEVTLRYADREETYQAGDTYHSPRGHIPSVAAGTEIVEFSPTAEYRRTLEVLAKNFAALQRG
jgi:hypothetical protein